MASALLTNEIEMFHGIWLPVIVSEVLSRAAASSLLQISSLLKHGSISLSDNFDETRTRILPSTLESSSDEDSDMPQKSRVGITNELAAPETSHKISRAHFSDFLLVAKSDDEDDDNDDEDDEDAEEEEHDEDECDDDGDDGDERESEEKQEGEDDDADDDDGDDDDDDDDDEEDYEDEYEDDDDEDDDEEESPPKKLRK